MTFSSSVFLVRKKLDCDLFGAISRSEDFRIDVLLCERQKQESKWPPSQFFVGLIPLIKARSGANRSEGCYYARLVILAVFLVKLELIQS